MGGEPSPADGELGEPTTGSGFVAVKICVSVGGVDRRRTVYVKPQAGAEKDGHAQRTLYVAGLPFWNHDYELVLRSLFDTEQCAIETVAVHPSKVSALVRFASKAGPAALLAAADAGRELRAELAPLDKHFGLRAMVEAHKRSFPGNAVLREQLDEWVANFEEDETRRKAEAAAAAEADQGWTLVKRKGGRRKSSDGAGTALGGVAPALAAAQAALKKDQAVADFYRFQQRDKRRNELAELRRNFEDDKRRIAQLRAARKFKPV